MIKSCRMMTLATATALMLAVSVGCAPYDPIPMEDVFEFVDPLDNSAKVTITRVSGRMHIFPPEPFPPSSIVVEGSENGSIVIGHPVGPIEDWRIMRILEDGTTRLLTLHNMQTGKPVNIPSVQAQEVTLKGEVIKVGMTYEELVDKLGKPSELRKGKNPGVSPMWAVYRHSDKKSYRFYCNHGVGGKIIAIYIEGPF